MFIGIADQCHFSIIIKQQANKIKDDAENTMTEARQDKTLHLTALLPSGAMNFPNTCQRTFDLPKAIQQERQSIALVLRTRYFKLSHSNGVHHLVAAHAHASMSANKKKQKRHPIKHGSHRNILSSFTYRNRDSFYIFLSSVILTALQIDNTQDLSQPVQSSKSQYDTASPHAA